MIKETTIVKEVEEVVCKRYCDVCGERIPDTLSCHYAKCQYCGKDLCGDCIWREEENAWEGRIVWCEKCWYIGNAYRIQIEDLRQQITELQDEWQSNCEPKDGVTI